jgi:Tfp pilus assembly protein PilV
MKKIIYSCLFVFIIALAFFGGRYQAISYSNDTLERQKIYMNTYNSVEIYRMNSYIASNIANQNFDAAKCEADREASRTFTDIQTCLSSDKCKSIIIKVAQVVAPELLQPENEKFKYYKNFKQCKPYLDR